MDKEAIEQEGYLKALELSDNHPMLEDLSWNLKALVGNCFLKGYLAGYEKALEDSQRSSK